MEKAFTQYLQSKDFSLSTRQRYTKDVANFLQWYGKDIMNCTKKDVLKYLEHLQKEKQWNNKSRACVLTSFNHYFTFLVKAGTLTNNPASLLKIRGRKKKTLYHIYTSEELTQIYDNYYLLYVQNFDDSKIPQRMRLRSELGKHRNYIMLGLLVYQGLATNELHKIKLTDIDFNKANVFIAGSRKSNERKIPLNASQIGALMHYIHTVRPQIIQAGAKDNGMLFLPLPEHEKSKHNAVKLAGSVRRLAVQVKALDNNFLKLQQLRASVINRWLKTEGLRKAQYLAGHRYISSTEYYLANNIENLIDDISKFNPF